MNPLGIVGAVVGGVVGALLWGLLTHLTGWEYGIIAWGVGGLVGFGCLCLGGRGSTAGAVCAIVAFLSILGGKFFATHMAIEQAIEQAGRAVHQEMVADAKDFANIEEYEYREFMVTHGYTEAEDAAGVSAEELDYFNAYSVPALQQVNVSPEYATWRESQFAENYCQSIAATLSVQDLVFDNLAPVDIVFFLLGVVTAFKVAQAPGLSREEEEGEAAAMVAAPEGETGLHEQPEEEREEREAETQL